jgi:hypothetical protein
MFNVNHRIGRLLLRFVGLGALLSCFGAQGCAPALPGEPGYQERASQSVSIEEISSLTTFGVGDDSGGVCTSFAEAHMERATGLAAALLNSHALESCVIARAVRYHIPDPSDPTWSNVGRHAMDLAGMAGTFLDEQRRGNHIGINCDAYTGTGASSAILPMGESGRLDYNFGRPEYDYWDQERIGNWYNNGIPDSTDAWYFNIPGMLHELSHSHGWTHPACDCTDPGMCAGHPAVNDCGWLEFCGGAASCRGFAYPCSDYTNTSQATCLNHQWCTWNATTHVCGGSAAPCTAFGADPNCENQDGCHWMGTPPGSLGSGCGDRNNAAALAGLDETDYADIVGGARDPSLTYIYDDCAGELLLQSANECSGGIFSSTCAPGELYLRTQYVDAVGTSDGPGDFNSTCACVPAARHAAHLRTYDGTHFLTAAGGGGSTLTASATHTGLNETFWMIDIDGDYLEDNDVVEILTSSTSSSAGYHIGGSPPVATYTNEPGTTIERWIVHRAAGGGRVVSGDVIGLRRYSTNLYMTAASGGGSSLTATQPNFLAYEQFTYIEPNRRHLVNFMTTDSSRYVTYTASASTELTTAALSTDMDMVCMGTPAACSTFVSSATCVQQQYCSWTGSACTGSAAACNLFSLEPNCELQVGCDWGGRATTLGNDQAFWIVDHNGGDLMHNDIVSLEGARSGTYWSSCVSGTGHVRGNETYDDANCVRFRISRAAGGTTGVTPIGHLDTISIYSMGQSAFVQTIAATHRLDANGGSGTSYRIEYVSGRDMRCTGTASSCTGRSQAQCGTGTGCTWSGFCSGTATSCATLPTTIYCAAQPGCSMGAGPSCTGAATACSAFGTSGTCGGQAGCSWVLGACTGTPTACGSLAIATTCSSQSGCTAQTRF